MTEILGNPIEAVVDGENNPIEFDLAYPLRGHPEAALEILRQRHGESIHLVPVSGGSCGGGIFQTGSHPPGTVIGLRLDPPTEARVSLAGDVDLTRIGIDEVVIDSERRRVCAGAAITLEQLNRALREQLGESWRVPGADLTSYQYAAVGATFMTGGMGPQRRYFSDSVTAIALYDGHGTRLIQGDALQAYAGTYGWSGLVSAVQCGYYDFPPDEIAFSLPVSDDPGSLARLLARLAPYTELRFDEGSARSDISATDLILGIEHVSCASMQPLLDQGAATAAGRRGAELREKSRLAGADGMIFVNGLTGGSTDEFLFGLVDDEAAESPTIAGIALEHAELFHDGDEMRELREAIPYAARMQTPSLKYLFKNHTDADIRLPPGDVEPTMTRLWQCNRDYVGALETYFDTQENLYGEVLVYGHLNPQGVDPHNRVTMGCDDAEQFAAARRHLIELRADYYRSVAALCRDSGAQFVGGEKTADSEREIFAALGGPEQAPAELFHRFERQRETVRAASPLFNWRAPPPYR
jgi:hypothetical protein